MKIVIFIFFLFNAIPSFSHVDQIPNLLCQIFPDKTGKWKWINLPGSPLVKFKTEKYSRADQPRFVANSSKGIICQVFRVDAGAPSDLEKSTALAMAIQMGHPKMKEYFEKATKDFYGKRLEADVGGEIWIENGVFKHINNKSGAYEHKWNDPKFVKFLKTIKNEMGIDFLPYYEPTEGSFRKSEYTPGNFKGGKTPLEFK
jgi:hypothetical protein